MKNSFVDKLIIFLFSIILLIDSINGYLLLNDYSTVISLSQLVKFPLLFLMIFKIFLLNKKYFLHLLLIICILLIAVFLNYFFQADVVLKTEFTLILKLLVIPISLYYFVVLKNKDYTYYNKSILKIFKISFLVLVVNIFLSVVGIGYSSYSEDIGNKGFFYAGNELSALYLVVSSYLLQYTYSKKTKKYYVVLAIITLLFAVSISTKVSMFSIFIVIVLIPLLAMKIKIDSKFILRTVFFSLLLVSVSILLYDSLINSSVFDRWVYFYKVYNYDFVSILLSGRNKTLVESFNMNDTYFEPINLFFGYTYSGFLNNIKQISILKPKANEMDFFDIYFFYGILGLLSILSVWLLSLYRFFISKKKNMILLVTVLLILFISFVSGHVLFSGLSGPFFGIYLSLMFHFNKKKLVL